MTTEPIEPSWWQRRSTLEKKLTFFGIFLLIASLVLVASLILIILRAQDNEENLQKNFDEKLNEIIDSKKSVSYSSNVTDYKDVCLSSQCIQTASQLLDAMDTDVDPCDDFYEFSCGRFLKNTFIPDEKTTVDATTLINDHLQEQLRLLISEESNKQDLKPFRLARDLYKACLNKTHIEERGLTPFLSILKRLGGWPLLVGNRWNERSWTWQQAIKDFRKIGFGVGQIINFYIGSDSKNSTRRIIYLDQSYPGLSREYLIKGLKDDIVKAYYDLMVDMAVIYGANRNVAVRELRETLDFQMALANITLPKEERRNDTEMYNPMTIREVQRKYPYVDWIDYINALLPPKLSVDMNEVIIIKTPTYFVELEKLLAKTSKRTIANYMMWRITGSASFFLTEELRKRLHKFSTIVSGQQEQKTRWKECIDITSGSLSISVGALYVRKHFKENSKQEMVEMVDGIRTEFENIINEVDWMDDMTKAAAQKKLKSIETHIGYPDELMDNQKLEEFYKNLEINPDRYFESALNMNLFSIDYEYNKFRKPINKTDWVDHAIPVYVNAFYSPNENSIQFPAAILQGQFFSAERPKYMNYGSIGAIIGHEITHGFDDQGRQFDENGNLVDWWQPSTRTAYLEKVKCIIEQYGNYTDNLSGLNLNGINTQGENIADNGGVKESYKAYKKWIKMNGPEPKLPGLNYTPEQMFWISFAQSWCTVQRPKSLKMSITLGSHSPEQFRVIGPISNMIDFSKDFNCPEDSRMNPTDKCEVW